jgi:hypothetical protein
MMKRVFKLVGLAFVCHFLAIFVAIAFSLATGAQDHPSPPDDPVYWIAFAVLLILAGRRFGFRLTPLGLRSRNPTT